MSERKIERTRRDMFSGLWRKFLSEKVGPSRDGFVTTGPEPCGSPVAIAYEQGRTRDAGPGAASFLARLRARQRNPRGPRSERIRRGGQAAQQDGARKDIFAAARREAYESGSQGGNARLAHSLLHNAPCLACEFRFTSLV